MDMHDTAIIKRKKKGLWRVSGTTFLVTAYFWAAQFSFFDATISDKAMMMKKCFFVDSQKFWRFLHAKFDGRCS